MSQNSTAPSSAAAAAAVQVDHSDFEIKVNILLSFCVEQCSLGDSIWIDVDWDSHQAQKDIKLFWTLKEEPGQDWSTYFNQRWSLLEKYLQPYYILVRTELRPSCRMVCGLVVSV